MKNHNHLEQSAQLACRLGIYRAAAQQFEHLRQEALNCADYLLAMRRTQEAANCWHLGGQPKRALGLLLEGFQAIDTSRADPSLIWDLRRQRFDWLRCFRPQVTKLEHELAAMDTFSRQHPTLPVSDLFRCRAVLARGQGNHAETLQWLERAWHRYHPGRGLPRSILAHNAACAALELGDIQTTRAWMAKLQACEDSREDAHAGAADLATRQALWDGHRTALQKQAEILQPHAHPYEQSIWWRRAATLRIRCLLLDAALGDPQSPGHPGRQQLCCPPVVAWEADERFHRAVVVLDYRLACLRYGLGLTSVEDLFFRQPSFSNVRFRPRISSKDIQVRIRRAYVALGRARRVAGWLDAGYACQWRQDLIKGRDCRLRDLHQLRLPL